MKLRLILLVLALLAADRLVGQTFRGTILGSVTDPSGAVVAGATVKIRNVATGLERTTHKPSRTCPSMAATIPNSFILIPAWLVPRRDLGLAGFVR